MAENKVVVYTYAYTYYIVENSIDILLFKQCAVCAITFSMKN